MTAYPVIRALWFIAALCGANTALASTPLKPSSPDPLHHTAQAAPPSDHATLLLHSPAPAQHLMDNSPRFSGWATPGHELIILIRDPDGMLVQTLEAQPDASGAWAVEASLMGDGDYHAELRLRAHADVQGQPAHHGPSRVRSTMRARFTLDTRVPAAYVLSHDPGERVEPGRPIAGMIDEPDAQLTVTLRDELGAVLGQHHPPIDADGAWQISPALASAGTYIIETTTRDRAGNQVTLARRFVQTAHAPTPDTLATADISKRGDLATRGDAHRADPTRADSTRRAAPSARLALTTHPPKRHPARSAPRYHTSQPATRDAQRALDERGHRRATTLAAHSTCLAHERAGPPRRASMARDTPDALT